jgi:hypothetical protein
MSFVRADTDRGESEKHAIAMQQRDSYASRCGEQVYVERETNG